MCSRCRELVFALCALALSAFAHSALAQAEPPRELRVCADPDNLPYSKADGSGFENRIAELLAADLRAHVSYTWLPQRRGFVRKTLNERLCDVIVGVPSDYDLVRTTQPYYRSTYVFVSRAGGEPYRDFDDVRLRSAKIGVQLIGDDLAATPPAHVLAARGITKNVVGYTVYGERPQAERMVEAVARDELDVALVWGPQGGFFAARQRAPLRVTPAERPPELAQLPFDFAMSMGVRKDDLALQRQLDDFLVRRRTEIENILSAYGIPRIDGAATRTARVSR